MKKILEVLQYGDTDIRFNTDFDPIQTPNDVIGVTSNSAFAMMTKLWGGNETAVLAMIRALAIADLAVSINRKQMIDYLDEQSALLAKSIQDAMNVMENRGVKFATFSPGINPPAFKN